MLFNKCRKMTKDSEDKEKKDKQKSKKYPMNKKRMMIFAVIILILVVSLQIGNNSSSDYSSCFDVSEYSLQENGMYTLKTSDTEINKMGIDLTYTAGGSLEEYYQKYYSNNQESRFRIVYTVEDNQSSESIYTITYEDNKIDQMIEDRIIDNTNVKSIKNYSYDSTTGKLDHIEETINNKTENQSATSFTSFKYCFVNDKELVVENYVYTNGSDTIKKTSAYFKEDILDNSLYQRSGIEVSKDDTLFDVLFKNDFPLEDYGSECYIVNKYQYLKVEENGINNLGYSYTDFIEFALFEDNKRNITGYSLKKYENGEYADMRREQMEVSPENINVLKEAYYRDHHLQWIDCKDEDAAKRIFNAKYGKTSKAKDEDLYNEFIENNSDYVIVQDYECTDEGLLFKSLPLKIDDPIVESIQNSVIDYSIYDKIKNEVEKSSEVIDEMKQAGSSEISLEDNTQGQNESDELLIDYLADKGIKPNTYTILFGFNAGEEDVYQVMGIGGGTIGWYAVSSEKETVSEYSLLDGQG